MAQMNTVTVTYGLRRHGSPLARGRCWDAVTMWFGSFNEMDRAMTRQNGQPSKESVRKWLRAQIEARRPPPDASQIRRELGWELVHKPRAQKR